jgi:hypothetical protein
VILLSGIKVGDAVIVAIGIGQEMLADVDSVLYVEW